ncbi:ABC transporter permease [Candidatus Dependentiae bacterium]|nr:ABC transporter permease [Candidatus Dependentiae bacterium]
MTNSFSDNFRIFCAIVRREWTVIKKRLWKLIIDGLVVMIGLVFSFSHLFPLLGMPKKLIAPIYLGNIITSLFIMGYTLAHRIVYDVKDNKFINYQMTLPLPKRWLFAAYVTAFVIEFFLVTVPLFVAGILIIKADINFANTSILSFAAIYLISLVFFALFYLGISLFFDFIWFRDNIWPRLLHPLLILSPIFVPWKLAYKFSPSIGIFFLINPLTYVVEGFRSSLLGNEQFINNIYCTLVVVLLMIPTTYLVYRGVHKRLDPV